MKKLSYLIAISLLLTACTANQSSSPTNSSSSAIVQNQATQEEALTYKDYVASLTPISFDELAHKMAKGESFHLFLGRETCKYCNIFVPKLHQVLSEQPTTVYYYNTEDASDQNLQAFRDKFGIQTVPNLSYYEGDQQVATLEKGSESNLEEIAAILDLAADSNS